MDRTDLIQGDITAFMGDAIVNAANNSLLGGGGVDGAIHRAAGPRLLEACRPLGGCPTGEARITPGFDLPAKWVIHTVGPVWRSGHFNEDEILAACYRHSLTLASLYQITTLAFPAISTGAYAFPRERAARIALREVANFLAADSTIARVTLVLRGDDAFRIHQAVRAELEHARTS